MMQTGSASKLTYCGAAGLALMAGLLLLINHM